MQQQVNVGAGAPASVSAVEGEEDGLETRSNNSKSQMQPSEQMQVGSSREAVGQSVDNGVAQMMQGKFSSNRIQNFRRILTVFYLGPRERSRRLLSWWLSSHGSLCRSQHYTSRSTPSSSSSRSIETWSPVSSNRSDP